VQVVRRLGEPDLDHLARDVPLVRRLRDVETLVALHAQQLGAEPACEALAELGLADAGLALEEQRAAELQAQVQRRGEAPVAHVLLAGEQGDDRVDRRGQGQGRRHGTR